MIRFLNSFIIPSFSVVIPVKAGIQENLKQNWIPAFAGMTKRAGMTMMCVFFLFSSFHQSFAFAPEEYLPESQEQRAREIFLQVKCPVCSGQVIESSDALVAVELRKLIRGQIKDGKSDEEIKNYLMQKYGDDILATPKFNLTNFWLWLLPGIFVICGLVLLRKKAKL